MRYLVHTRNLKSSPYGLDHHNDTQGLALPRPTMREGSLCRLHGHLAKKSSKNLPDTLLGPQHLKTKHVMSFNTKRGKASHLTHLTTTLMLNSFWGTFRENLLKPTTEAVQASHLIALVSNPFNNIHQVRIANKDTLEVVYANFKDNQPDNRGVNIFVAALTTCHARLKLYEYLERLQQRVLYFNTDLSSTQQTRSIRYSSETS